MEIKAVVIFECRGGSCSSFLLAKSSNGDYQWPELTASPGEPATEGTALDTQEGNLSRESVSALASVHNCKLVNCGSNAVSLCAGSPSSAEDPIVLNLSWYHLKGSKSDCQRLYKKLTPNSAENPVPMTAEELVETAWSSRRNLLLRFPFKAEIISFPKALKASLPFLFNAPAVELELDRFVRDLLARQELEITPQVEVRVRTLSPDHAKLRVERNRNAKASIEVLLSGCDAEQTRAMWWAFPDCIHGVFVFHSEGKEHASRARQKQPEFWTWRPRLVPRPGVWKIRKLRYSKGKRKEEVCFRLGLSNGKFLDVPCDPEKLEEFEESVWKRRSAFEGIIALPRPDEIPNVYTDLKAFVDMHWPAIFFEQPRQDEDATEGGAPEPIPKPIEKLLQLLQELPEQDENAKVYDEQDLEYQRLYTYSAFIIDKFERRLIEALCRPTRESDLEALPQRTPLTTRNELLGVCTLYGSRSTGAEDKWLQPLNRLNGIEVISQLTAFDRYAPGMARRPAPVLQQNHPSFAGYVCPVESPESKRVGITLHLAEGTLADVRGNLSRTGKEPQHAALGYAASLVPFYQHNDGPRSMMGAKNLKQAVPLAGAVSPLLKTGSEEAPKRVLEPLIQAGVIPDEASFFSPGVDLLVAYMPWYGWNYEDAIVANERLVHFDETYKTYSFDYGFIEEFSLPIQRGWELCEPRPEDPWHKALVKIRYAENLLQPGVFVSVDTELAFFEKEGVRRSIRAGVHSGELVSIAYEPPSELLSGRLDWSIRTRLPLNVGDKLMGRYGNKGVISTFFPPEKMPRLPEDPRLGALSGKPVDLILNPHGVVSRMNLGQLIETQLGLLAKLGGEISDFAAGKAFQPIDLRQIKREFQKINEKRQPAVIDEYGRMYLTLPGSDSEREQTTCPVVVGMQHFVRLNHAPVTKAAVHSSDAYSLRTGQPTRTAAAGDRPQRLGEMEIWALAAHQATKSLQSALVSKSSPPTAGGARESQVFPAICDHLFALGIVVENPEDQEFQFRYAKPADVTNKGREVSSPRVWRQVNVSRHKCSKCDYALEEMAASARTQRSQELNLCIGDILEHHGLTPAFQEDRVLFGKWDGNTQKKTIRPSVLSSSGKQKIVFTLARTARQITVGFTVKKQKYAAYAQIAQNKEFFKEGAILGLRLTCPTHSSSHLQPLQPSREIRPVPGGLADESIFGRVDQGGARSGGWGHICLPEEIQQPLFPLSAADEDNGNVPRISCIPVLPLRYRYPRPEIDRKGTVVYTEQLTRLYEEILRARDSYMKAADACKKASEDEDSEDEEIRTYGCIKASRENRLYMALSRLRRALAQQVFTKQGIIRRQGLGRRVDYSARFVIVPDPGLAWESCGVPLLALYEWFKNEIELEDEIKGHLKQAMAYIWATGSTRNLSDQQKSALETLERVLKDYLANHEHIRVLLNRQPSLHRYSIQAFCPEVLPAEKGFVLSINPLVCAGFGADFDGDAMAIHLITDPDECKEADRMLPTAKVNLLSLANGKPVASYSQDIVLGSYILSKNQETRSLLPSSFTPCEECEECKRFLSPECLLDAKTGREFLEHLCKAHPTDVAAVLPHWMNRAFKAATEAGVSYGFLELAGVKINRFQALFDRLSKGTLPLGKINDKLDKYTLKSLKKALADPKNPGYGLAAMALSGARDGKQVRQLLAARGYLDPADTGFDVKPMDFVFDTSLCEGMTPEQAFFAAMNGRSSMIDKKYGTPKAGYLTRKLVLACWPWHVKKGTCKASTRNRSISTCAFAKDRAICSACYGEVFGYTDLDGFPAGLIAAQSVGERGTQLSMQSFHSGERAISLDEVDALFEGRYVRPKDRDKPKPKPVNLFETNKRPDAFLKIMKRQKKAYGDIENRHLELIWRIIHESVKKTLSGASGGQFDLLSGLVGPAQRAFIKQAADCSGRQSCVSPLANVLRSRLPILEERKP